MKFNIEKIVLWLKSGKLRELKFKPNKVNIITGDSNTGKTAIYEIIDYCFFASESKISESKINEKVGWYGVLININDKKYCIARKSLHEGRVSNEYYFSSNGKIPTKPMCNNDESTIKILIETEFGINQNVKVAYGNNAIRADSKISLRYFLLFNYISQNLIINDNLFIEDFNKKRYIEAIPRIFDIATGIETIQNKLLKEKLDELNSELKKLERKNRKISDKRSIFQSEKNDLLKQAREYGLVETGANDDEAYGKLITISADDFSNDDYNNQRSDLEKQHDILRRRKRLLNDFIDEYESYKKNLRLLEDSLKPIEFLKNSEKVIETKNYNNLLEDLSSELNVIKKIIKKRAPINVQVLDEKKKVESEIALITTKLESLPKKHKVIENQPKKYMFLGALQERSKLYDSNNENSVNDYSKQIENIKSKIEECKKKIIDTEKKKELTINLIEEIITGYISESKLALKNYADYMPVFDYKNKLLKLRRPLTTYLESVGSASNYMFLQLFFSLAIHEVIFLNKSNFVSPFLIIDQFSTPYFEGDQRKKDTEGSDEEKIHIILKLLNNYIKRRLDNEGNFQIIAFEHIPPKYFKKLEHFHLVEEFNKGNALVND